MSASRRASCWGVAAIIALAIGYTILVRPVGANGGSHYALVRAFANGTANIDAYHRTTGDSGYFRGHWFSDKAPGLALATVPAYLLLRSVGAPEIAFRITGSRAGEAAAVVSLLGVWSVVIPALLLLLLVRNLADEVAPGYGSAAAVTLGVSTLVLPFSTLFFSHILSSLLLFASFVFLWRERRCDTNLLLVTAAGALAGLAVTTEYPAVIVALVLGVYASARGGPLLRGAAFAGGAGAGIAPLLLYNWRAFGAITHLSYADRVPTGWFGFDYPSLSVVVQLLLSAKGLLTLSPVVAVGGVGTVLLFKHGRRIEAVVISAIVVLSLVYNSAYYAPLGGGGPGPRYLISILPFLAIPLALAYQRFSAATLGLAVVSAATLLIATTTDPLLGTEDTHHWVTLAARGDFRHTLATSVGAGHGWLALAPFLAVIATALVFAISATAPIRVTRQGLARAAVASLGWGLVAASTPHLLGAEETVQTLSLLAALALLAAVSAAVASTYSRGSSSALTAASPVVLCAWPRIGQDAKSCLVVSLLALALVGLAQRKAWLHRAERLLPGRLKT